MGSQRHEMKIGGVIISLGRNRIFRNFGFVVGKDLSNLDENTWLCSQIVFVEGKDSRILGFKDSSDKTATNQEYVDGGRVGFLKISSP